MTPEPTTAAAAYSPAYRLKINGDDLPASVRSCLTSVRYEDGLEGSDQVTFNLANPNGVFLRSHIRGLALRLPTAIGANNIGGIRLPPPQLSPGGPLGGLHSLLEDLSGASAGLLDMDNEVRLSLGYEPDPPTEVFLGEITGLAADFPEDGMPTITVTAHDFLQRAMRGTASRGFGPLPDAAVVSILALENGLIPLLDPTMIPLDTINTIGNFLFGTGTKQVRESSYHLLTRIGERFDMEVRVEGHVLYFSRFLFREYSPRMTLTYGRSLLEFTPRVSSVGQAIGVTHRVTLREIRVDLILKVFWDVDRERIGVLVLPGMAAKLMPALGAPAVESKNRTIRNAIDVANTVVGLIHQLRKKLNNRITGTGSAVGDPAIRAGAILQLEGLGADFSGAYRVTKAVHTVDVNGYRTQFEAQKVVIP